MAVEQISDLDFVDAFYVSAIIDESDEEAQHDETFPISDAKYAEALQFQEALMGSVMISQMKNSITTATIINTCKISNPSSLLMIEPPPVVPNSPTETGQSSQIFCEICVEKKETDQMFATDSCIHSFCLDCVGKYVGTKIQESQTIVTCPGMNCRAVLELDICRTKLAKGVIDSWEEALCKEMISTLQSFYCPFRDCSALLVNDNEGEVIRESECPFCHRLFCAQCYVPWHSGIECEAFQRLNEDERGREDLMVIELAKEKKWSRCPKCRFYVERTQGCPHMVCRCGFQFCYGCELEWTGNHGGCHKN
ncbi:E3 ubiquitin-protein ligase RSL1 [Ricinus communis]|uniref:RBR-type E3 ubiquitin transferase n=1 Tax=Ricinus communis TaxID=3988 RepID=B9RGS0_RICCO|nr:E3 ubiquitin-protein ligase RSL1 [Ricinus communis]EEF49282.1 zinc finger protein, putative [Ricinus communis]|eukprot:XP_002512779.1 probable E3 ubiquitin-protein ligase RNF217 [Ricinus communis]